jgi:hypothetical protein
MALTMSKDGISAHGRERLFAAVGYRCQACGRRAQPIARPSGRVIYPIIGAAHCWLSVDHVYHWRRDDLAVLCTRCNSQKALRLPRFDLVVVGTPGMHLADISPEPEAFLAPTRCGKLPTERRGGWPRPNPDERHPEYICRRCWLSAQRGA